MGSAARYVLWYFEEYLKFWFEVYVATPLIVVALNTSNNFLNSIPINCTLFQFDQANRAIFHRNEFKESLKLSKKSVQIHRENWKNKQKTMFRLKKSTKPTKSTTSKTELITSAQDVPATTKDCKKLILDNTRWEASYWW